MRGLGDSYKMNINFDNPSVICFANATSLYTREAFYFRFNIFPQSSSITTKLTSMSPAPI